MLKVEGAVDAHKLRMKPEVSIRYIVHVNMQTTGCVMYTALVAQHNSMAPGNPLQHPAMPVVLGSLSRLGCSLAPSCMCACKALRVRMLQVVLFEDLVQRQQALRLLMGYNPFWLTLAVEVITHKPFKPPGVCLEL